MRCSSTATREPSSFAKKRGLVKPSVPESPTTVPANITDIIGDIVERPVKDPESTMVAKETIPRVSLFSAVLGDIVERMTGSENERKYKERDSGENGFPKAVRISRIGLVSDR